MNAVGWLERKFRDRREWDSDQLLDAAWDEDIDRGALFSTEVKALPIRRKRVVETGAKGERWLWVADASWPAGHIRPKATKPKPGKGRRRK